MSQIELTRRILARLDKEVAFGGKTKRKTIEGEVILKCPVWNKSVTLEPLSSDIAGIFITYIEEEGLKQIKAIIKDILK